MNKSFDDALAALENLAKARTKGSKDKTKRKEKIGFANWSKEDHKAYAVDRRDERAYEKLTGKKVNKLVGKEIDEYNKFRSKKDEK